MDFFLFNEKALSIEKCMKKGDGGASIARERKLHLGIYQIRTMYFSIVLSKEYI